ncbi:hypothetical protein [Kitasatospora sp. NPDC059571]|uniref:hypothetical protein n=1 Tax=Kitasatospora sp. NPDC059571 TaxID=3346871 RepID=UPI003677EF38
MDEQPESDHYGWPVASLFAGSAPGMPLADMRHVPALVLRGEWGMGKSCAFDQELADLEAAGLSAKLLDLGKCGTDAARAEVKLAQVFEPPAGSGEWHVLLDGLDEGLDHLLELDQLIIEQLEAVDDRARDGLRLRISCRTARWPADLERELGRFWSEEQVRVVGLAPLSREDVSTAAEVMGAADPSVFTGLVQQRGLVALATNPLTLRQLLTGYTTNGHLPVTAEEAYREACLHLCKETRRPKGNDQRRTLAAPEHLLAVAARVAAAMQFGSYTGLSEDPPQPGSASAGDLALSWVASGDEPGHLGTPVPCSMNELHQLTESSLLVPLEGSYRWSFAHKSYQEFLAAEFLRGRGMSASVQRELLWVGDGEARHVIPAHQAVAAWRSATDSEVFEDLVRDDPTALLLADLESRPDEDRARVVAALLALLKRDDTAHLERSTLHRLRHSDLAAQLRPYLRSATEVNLLYGAVSIARACACPDLADDLLTVAEDTNLNPEVRVAALGGVTDPANAAVGRLKTLADDDSPEVVAAALRRLRPDHLSLTEFLAKVRDPDPSYIGTAFMLRREIPEQISLKEIVEATVWARGVLTDPVTHRSPDLAVAVLARAVTLADQVPSDDDLVAIVAEAMMALVLDSDLFFNSAMRSPYQELGAALSDSEDTRRRLAYHLMTQQDSEHFITLLSGLMGGSLLQADDLVYWAENWELLDSVSPHLRRLAVGFPRPGDPEILARCEAARAAYPSLREATAFWDNPPVEDPYERERREAVEAQRRQNTYSEPGLREALAAVTAAGAETVYERWADVVNHMLRTASGETFSTTEPPLTIASEAPSRPAPGSELSDAVAQAAQHLVRIAPALSPARLTPRGAFEFSNAPDLSAFAFLECLPSEVDDPQKWAGWAVALASTQAYNFAAQSIQRRFLPLCAARAGDALSGFLTEVLNAVHDDTVRTIARAYAALPDGLAHAALRAWAGDPDRRPEQWQAVIGELAVLGNEGAMESLAGVLAMDPAGFQPQSNERVRWMLAATTLLHCDRLRDHWSAVRSGLEDQGVLQDFMEGLGQLPAPPGSWPAAVGLLSDRDIADLYRLLVGHIGVEAASTRALHNGFVRGEDRVQDMVYSLPHILSAHNTEQAAAELRGLASEYPAVWQLRLQARTTARAAAARNAAPIPPEQLLQLAAHSTLRVVRDERHLLDIVSESLKRFQQALHRPNGLIVALWNRESHGVNHTDWWPCWEEDFSDIVATFLLQDIGGHRVVINREVQVLRPGFPGLRTDIQIELPACEGTGDDPIKLVIECKGCWNSSLSTALADQLVAGYLQTPRTAGVLLTGYFHCDRWGARKRSCPTHGHSLDEVRQHQDTEAHRQRELRHVSVAAVTLDCGLPDSTVQWRTTALPTP